tara:strand:- start:158 stop:295 length:138 start_codon:yes stop_codon:yes gene_type:complete
MGNLSNSILKSPTGLSRRVRCAESDTNEKNVFRLATTLAGLPTEI